MGIQDDAHQDTVDAIKAIDPIIEGWMHQLEAADLSSAGPASARSTLGHIASAYTHRRELLEAHRISGEALLADGYPELPASVVPAGVFDEVAQNKSATDAAFALLGKEPEATGGTFTLDKPEKKKPA